MTIIHIMLLQIVCILLWDIFCVYVRVRINKDNIYIHASRQVMKTHKQTRWFETSSAPSVIPVVLKWRHKQFLLETSGAQSINAIRQIDIDVSWFLWFVVSSISPYSRQDHVPNQYCMSVKVWQWGGPMDGSLDSQRKRGY